MAKIIRCDGGCGTESPDERGSFIANSWVMMIAGVRLKADTLDDTKHKIFCAKCWERLCKVAPTLNSCT